jgi:prophage regulatory protein
MATTPTRLLRLPRVRDLTGFGTTSIYGRAKAGLFTPPVKLTERCSAWPEHEVAAINGAVIAGKSEDEIRALVAQLIVQRKQPQAAAPPQAA